MENTEDSRAYPGLPEVSLSDFRTLFTGQNLKIGAALFWRVILAGFIFDVINKLLAFWQTMFTSMAVERLDTTFLYIAKAGTFLNLVVVFLMIVFLAIWIPGMVAKSFYGVSVRGIPWSYLWRSAVVMALQVIMMVPLAFIFIRWGYPFSFVKVLGLLVGALLIVPGGGWALHRQLAIDGNPQ